MSNLESIELDDIATLEKALIHYETLTACATFEAGFLALPCLAISPTEKINGITEATMIEC
jgi:hypothetical protein